MKRKPLIYCAVILTFFVGLRTSLHFSGAILHELTQKPEVSSGSSYSSHLDAELNHLEHVEKELNQSIKAHEQRQKNLDDMEKKMNTLNLQ